MIACMIYQFVISLNFFLYQKYMLVLKLLHPSGLISFQFNFILLTFVFKAVEWLSELLDALLKTHIRLGDDAQETKVLLEKHRKFVDVAQVK